MQEGQIPSHYKILRSPGKGGMGEVYLAHDAKLDRQLALKTLPSAFAADPQRLARLLLTRADPSAIGTSSIGGLLEVVSAADDEGLLVEMGTAILLMGSSWIAQYGTYLWINLCLLFLIWGVTFFIMILVHLL